MPNDHDRIVVEFPRLKEPPLTRSDLKPSRFEGLRVSIARYFFLHLTFAVRVALRIAPQSHPWTILTRSAYEDIRHVTHVGLRERGREGVEVARSDLERHDRRRSDRWRMTRRLLVLAWSLFTLWLVLDPLTHTIKLPGGMAPTVEPPRTEPVSSLPLGRSSVRVSPRTEVADGSIPTNLRNVELPSGLSKSELNEVLRPKAKNVRDILDDVRSHSTATTDRLAEGLVVDAIKRLRESRPIHVARTGDVLGTVEQKVTERSSKGLIGLP